MASNKTNNAGINTFDAFSIPPLMPNMIIKPAINIKMAVKTTGSIGLEVKPLKKLVAALAFSPVAKELKAYFKVQQPKME